MEDLSHLATKSLSAGSSMAGGNTMSEDAWGKLPSTESEQSSDIDQSYAHGTPDLEEGTPTGKYVKRTGPGTFTPSPLTWKKTK
jgi:hypothetical protein